MSRPTVPIRAALSPPRQHWSRGRRFLVGTIASLLCLTSQRAIAVPPSPTPTPTRSPSSTPIRPRVTCPTQLQPLTAALLRDLPQYINRLSHQRGGSQAAKYAIASSPANLEPLPVVTSVPDPQDGGLYQTFFTLLERQYVTQRKIDYQNYYWLFLAHTPATGWQLAILYTRSGPYPNQQQAPTPLREATREVPGLAIRQWLRDCQAGAVNLLQTTDEKLP
ncbi:MAG: hypothetical protein NW220_02085 [Leptolyngbyaceae cyanobacterium bins.349]|nr:hypothetical protein [Leptolyngbyaceae cyanobacterium bins.349]